MPALCMTRSRFCLTMGFNQRGHQLNVALTVIQTGKIVERFATTVQKISWFCSAISSSVSKQSTERQGK